MNSLSVWLNMSIVRGNLKVVICDRLATISVFIEETVQIVPFVKLMHYMYYQGIMYVME